MHVAPVFLTQGRPTSLTYISRGRACGRKQLALTTRECESCIAVPPPPFFCRFCSCFPLLLIAAPGFLKGQAPIPPIPANHVRIHYFRLDGNYLGWTVYAFGDTTEDTSNFNGGPVKVTGQDSFGAFFDVGVSSTAQNVGIIIHKGNIKVSPGPMNSSIRPLRATSTGKLSGSNVLRTAQPPTIQQSDPPIPAGKARIHYHRPRQ